MSLNVIITWLGIQICPVYKASLYYKLSGISCQKWFSYSKCKIDFLQVFYVIAVPNPALKPPLLSFPLPLFVWGWAEFPTSSLLRPVLGTTVHKGQHDKTHARSRPSSHVSTVCNFPADSELSQGGCTQSCQEAQLQLGLPRQSIPHR